MELTEQGRQQYEEYVRQLREAEHLQQRAQQQATALRKIVEGFTELHPELRSNGKGAEPTAQSSDQERQVPAERTLSGKKAVAFVLANSDESLTVEEIWNELSDRGMAPPTEEALRTTLHRMFNKDGTVTKHDKAGRLAYRWNAEVSR